MGVAKNPFKQSLASKGLLFMLRRQRALSSLSRNEVRVIITYNVQQICCIELDSWISVQHVWWKGALMNEAMVTARMSADKKEEGTRILSQLGTTASQAINEMYDYLIEHRALPLMGKGVGKEEGVGGFSFTEEQWSDACAHVKGMRVPLRSEFAAMSLKDAKMHRLRSKGYLDGLAFVSEEVPYEGAR